MSDVIGHMSFPTTAEEKRSGMVGEKPYSRKLRNTIDLEVNQLVARAHHSTVQTLNAHMDKLHLLAGELMKRESLTYQEIVQLIGEPVNAGRYRTATQPLSAEAEKWLLACLKLVLLWVGIDLSLIIFVYKNKSLCET